MSFDFDDEDFSPKDVDEGKNSVAAIPPGMYKAVLIDSGEKDIGTNTVTTLKFSITEGPFKGRHVKADLFHQGKDAEKTKKMKAQMYYFGEKLGLLERDGERYKKIAPRDTFDDCRGELVVIDVENKPDQNDRTKVYSNVKLFGIHKVTDPEATGQKGKTKTGGANASRNGQQQQEVDIDV